MPALADRDVTYWALADKRTVLTQYIQELLKRSSEDPDSVRIEARRAEIELELTQAMITELYGSQPLALPDAPTVAALRQSVAALAQIIGASAALNVLIASGDALIQAWPR